MYFIQFLVKLLYETNAKKFDLHVRRMSIGHHALYTTEHTLHEHIHCFLKLFKIG